MSCGLCDSITYDSSSVSCSTPRSARPSLASACSSYLRFWPSFFFGVGKPRREPASTSLASAVAPAPRVAMVERDVAPRPGSTDERNADDARLHRIEARRLDVEGRELGAVDGREPQRVEARSSHGLVDDLRGRRGDAPCARARPRSPERRPAVSVAARLAISPGHVGRGLRRVLQPPLELEALVHRRNRAASVAPDADPADLTGSSQSVFTVSRRLPCGSQASASRRLSPTTPPISRACAMMLSSEPYCASHFAAVFGPDLRHARHVVDGVAGERQQIEHLVRAHVELREHAGLVERLVAHRVDELDAGTHELRQVLVRRSR